MALWRRFVSDVLHQSTSEDCDKIPVQDCSTLFYIQWASITWGYGAQQGIHRSLHTIAAPQPKTD